MNNKKEQISKNLMRHLLYRPNDTLDNRNLRI